MSVSTSPIVIVGSGFAAYQLVKTLRRQGSEQPITVITADNGDEYSKPDLSHVFSKTQTAADLVKQSGESFAAEHNIRLLNHCRVESINPASKTLVCLGETASRGEEIVYDKLVLATGAKAFVPPMSGDASDDIITLNGLEEYQASEDALSAAQSVLVIGAGLIGTEIAMDLASSGKQVVLADRADSLLPSLLPGFISSQLYQRLAAEGVNIELGTQVQSVNRLNDTNEIQVTLANGRQYHVDSVICAVGLQSNTRLAIDAGLNVDRGIVVDRQLRTSAPDIFALGDCAQIEDKVLSFLQPILLSANALAKTLLGQPTQVKLPAMLVKVKTPLLPMQLSGNTTCNDAFWQVEATREGMTARAFDDNQKLVGFVVTDAHMKQAFPLLRQLPAVV